MDKTASACLFWLKVSLIGSLHIVSLAPLGRERVHERQVSTGLKAAFGQDRIPHEVEKFSKVIHKGLWCYILFKNFVC